ncbi:MAG: noncanonical pyrimidine nucleotidase, YjjG family [Ruminococcaceae bacterium]|nr:noncanonical pyrimidine nucleotidase, YjjG family [Oscillospiraceae bacterium]
MLKVLLWDVDGTLLNFREAEKIGIRNGFARLGLGECTEEMLADYSAVNRRHWEMLERGELTKAQVLEGRFVEFFTKYGIRTDCIAEFNRGYQIDLGETVCFQDGALETLQALAPTVRQYAVTNGTKIAQEKKLEKSGLNKILDGAFISEDVGAEKPSAAFFEAVWKTIGKFDPDEIMIIGDSLTSDIRGGNNVGIHTCWYCPTEVQAPEAFRIDFQIKSLREIPKIVFSMNQTK